MNSVLSFFLGCLAAIMLTACASSPSETASALSTGSTGAVAVSTAGENPPAPAASTTSPSTTTISETSPPSATLATASPPKPSLKDTQHQDRELGKAVVPYPFDSCAVIQRPFGPEGPKHRRVYQGQEVLFCCTPCLKAFDANPEPYMLRIVEAAQAKTTASATSPTGAN